MKKAGQTYALFRDGARLRELEGLPTLDRSSRAFVGFHPGSDIRPGDRLEGLITGDVCHVIEVASDVLDGKVFMVKGYYQTGREHDRARTQPEPAAAMAETSSSADPTKVFVVHGRNHAARDAMLTFLQALGLMPIEWDDAVRATGEGTPHIGRILEVAFERAQAVVVLLTGDDEARLLPRYQTATDAPYEKDLTPQPRPNVLFEAGMAFGYNPKRTILVQLGPIRPLSDLSGRHFLEFSGAAEERIRLKDRLRTAGCVTKESGTFWLTAGNFAQALEVPAR
jgi:predicted nucleotide-binding protein